LNVSRLYQKTLPKDFTFNELSKLLTGLGFEISNKGKTSGSRVRFMNVEKKSIIDLHKPHSSGSPIRESALKDICEKLFAAGFIETDEESKKKD
jgi:hypothetical protein